MKYLELLFTVSILTSTIGLLTATQEGDTSASSSLDLIESTLSNVQTYNEVIDIDSQDAAHLAKQVSLEMSFEKLPSEVQKMMETAHRDSFLQTDSHLPRPVKVEDIVAEPLTPLHDNIQESSLEKLEIELSILDEFLDTPDDVQSEETSALRRLETQRERVNSDSNKFEETHHPNKERTTNQVPLAALRLIRQSENFDFGNLPTRPEIQSVLEYSEDAVQTFYNLVRSFINTVLPGPLPYGK